MGKLIFGLVMLLCTPLLAATPTFNWKASYQIGYIKINSINILAKKQLNTIISVYERSAKLFFTQYENIDITGCALSGFTVNVISPEQINNKVVFDNPAENVFGRYYWKTNTVFITPEMFNNHDYLAHEIAHYFYDECGIFRGVDKEEAHSYEFQKLYLISEGLR